MVVLDLCQQSQSLCPVQEAHLLPGEVLSSLKEEEWEVVQTGMENTFCAPRSSVPLRVRNDTHGQETAAMLLLALSPAIQMQAG